MNLTLHAEERVAERLLMGKEALMELLQKANGLDWHLSAPRWWYGYKAKEAEALYPIAPTCRWHPFKDEDGIEAVALVDLDRLNVVTVAKRER